MVKVVITGRGKERMYDIATINAGVVLRTDGGIFLQICSKSLSRDLKRFFDEQGRK